MGLTPRSIPYLRRKNVGFAHKYADVTSVQEPKSFKNEEPKSKVRWRSSPISNHAQKGQKKGRSCKSNRTNSANPPPSEKARGMRMEEGSRALHSHSFSRGDPTQTKMTQCRIKGGSAAVNIRKISRSASSFLFFWLIFNILIAQECFSNNNFSYNKYNIIKRITKIFLK